MRVNDDIIPHVVEDYQNATAAEVARLESIPGVVSVYSTGMVKAPGISDLDLIAVVDVQRMNGKVPWALRYALSTPTERYIRTHPIFVVSPEFFSDLNWLGDLSSLVHLHGERFRADSVPGSSEGSLSAITLLETGFHKLFALRSVIMRSVVSARDLLLTLNSVGYSLSVCTRLADCCGEFRQRIEGFRERLTSLRASWHKNSVVEHACVLAELVEQAPELLFRAVGIASSYLVGSSQMDMPRANASARFSIDPFGAVGVDCLQRHYAAPFVEGEFFNWCRNNAAVERALLSGPVGLGLSFVFYRDFLHESCSRGLRNLESRVSMSKEYVSWCRTAKGPTRGVLEQRARTMCGYANWFRQFRQRALAFSPYTSWLTVPPSKIELVTARLENRVFSTLARAQH